MHVVTSDSLISGRRRRRAQLFGWDGDASGTENPLHLPIDTNKTVTAQFSHMPTLALTSASLPMALKISGADGDVWTIEASTDLTAWTSLLTLTNFYSFPVFFSDQASTNFQYRMYRAVSR